MYSIKRHALSIFASACLIGSALAGYSAVAQAAAPLTQREADAAAKRTVSLNVAAWNEELDLYPITSYELDPCEVGRRKAVCAYTVTYDGGDDPDSCDGEIVVQRGRRGKLGGTMTEFVCDSDT